jgi:Activator of Hsp90 ATPase homolog 1-like protein
MTQMASVRVSVTVDVDPETAFEIFTGEIDEWYRKGVSLLTSRDRSRTLRFEPGVGGRLVELGRNETTLVERGRITVWEPGVQLVFVDLKQTEVDVRFEPFDDGTRVVLEHRGLDRLSPDEAASTSIHGWRRLAGWFEVHTQEVHARRGSER